jgi:hypothetical protein
MAYPDPDVLIVVSPQSQRVGEIRLYFNYAAGGPQLTGYTEEEARMLDRAINIADPRYGDDPEGAMKLLREQGFHLYGKLYKRTMSIAEASIQLNLSRQRIQQLISDGRLSTEIDTDKHSIVPYRIYVSSIWRFEQQERPAHRPRKETSI